MSDGEPTSIVLGLNPTPQSGARTRPGDYRAVTGLVDRPGRVSSVPCSRLLACSYLGFPRVLVTLLVYNLLESRTVVIAYCAAPL